MTPTRAILTPIGTQSSNSILYVRFFTDVKDQFQSRYRYSTLSGFSRFRSQRDSISFGPSPVIMTPFASCYHLISGLDICF